MTTARGTVPYVARAWVDAGTAEWGPLRLLMTAYGRLGYRADRWGLGTDVVLLLSGPEGPPAAPASRSTRTRAGGPVLVGVGAATVACDRGGLPTTVLDVLGETWSVEEVTGVWTQPGLVPAAAVRTAWLVRLACWHSPSPGTAAVLTMTDSGTWHLRPPR